MSTCAMSGRTRKSGVWEFFFINLVDDSKVTCCICDTEVSRGGKVAKDFNTSNMRKHLRNTHPEDYKKLQTKEDDAKEGKSRQLSIGELFEKSQPYPFDHPRSREITKRIGEMIAVDNEPFTLVDHAGFSRLLLLLEPRYKLPSERYFSETLIPAIYQKVSDKVKALLSSTDHVSVTTDVWSSVAQDSYISLTCHYISSDFKHHHVCLNAAPFNDRHTGEHISAMINNCLQSWNLADKLHVVVHDNGSNFVAGLRNAKIPNIPYPAVGCEGWVPCTAFC